MRSPLKAGDHCRFEDLVDYANGDADRGHAAAIAEHISACPRCRRQLVGVSATLEAAAVGRTVDINSMYASGFPALVLSGIRQRKLGWRLSRLALGAAALGVAMVLWIAFGGVTSTAGDAGPQQVATPSTEVAAAEDPGASDFDYAIDDYWIETATTDELLSEVGALDREVVMVMLEEI